MCGRTEQVYSREIAGSFNALGGRSANGTALLTRFAKVALFAFAAREYHLASDYGRAPATLFCSLPVPFTEPRRVAA